MGASRRRAVVLALGASTLALVACDAILDLGQYTNVACSGDCDDAGKESGTVAPRDASPDVEDAFTGIEGGVDAGDGGTDADATILTTPDGGYPAPTGHETWAHWPMPNPDASLGPESSTALPNQMGYTTGADGGGSVAYDTVTKLTWWRQALAASTYDEAWLACTKLGAGNGWRVPTRIELVSLIDFTRVPTLETTTFVDAGAVATWTSSSVPGEDGSAGYWAVDFSNGLTVYGVSPMQVLCVNGGTP
jgi:hypothetical protein